MVRDNKAESLENAGLWRRAATRWLHVMQLYKNHSDEISEREWILLRRNMCIKRARRSR
ncbi:PerC family transcriptional regulator [Salmonella enterica]|nr:PerC family transcriptional regulator [Salmonella enterica]EEJ9029148.1 PerC family transcriptional regulator [Salmonella enterica subsp. enterica]ELC5052958.1 PerC family transcriptional regulator [Salmonella enterica]